MVTEIILAVFAPFIMCVFMTRVTFNHYVSALLTLVVISAIHMKYDQPSFVIIFWGASLTAGFFVSKVMKEKLIKK